MKNEGTRLKIGVDIDGVLIDSDVYEWMNFCERQFGWDIDYEIFKETHSLLQAVQKTRPEMSRAFEQFIDQVEEAQKPVQGAHDALKKLGKMADIFLITARGGTVRDVTEKFLREHLSDVRFQEISMDNLEGKVKQIISFGIDYFIDDSYREVSLILQNHSVSTKIIPFPGFHGMDRWGEVNDTRIHWLKAWEAIEDGLAPEYHPEIRKAAWEEIVEFIRSQGATVHRQAEQSRAGL